MELPPQGRITDTTPDEWFADIMPFYSMVLLAQELLARIYRQHILADSNWSL